MTNRLSPSRLTRSCVRSGACALGFAFLGHASTASAQEWLKDRSAEEGAGIRVGNLELHPGIGGEIGYDSNYFLRTYKDDARFVNGSPAAAPVDTGELRITPSITLKTLGSQRAEGSTSPSPVVFQAGLSGTYREFLSGNSDIRDQRNMSLNAFARADFFQNRPLGFDVYADYTRIIQPSVVFDPDLSFNSDSVHAGADVVVIPGGGTLDIRAGYSFTGTFYEETNAVPYTTITHEISVRDRWRFRPRTALFHDTTLRWNTYPDNDRSLFYLDQSTPVRTRIGLTGLLTDRIGVLLAVGYGASFFEKPSAATTTQYDGILANAELTYYIARPDANSDPGATSLLLSKFVLGYSRDFSNSLLSNYYTSNKGYARVEYFFAGKALITLSGYFEGLSYPQPYYLDPATGNPIAVGGTVSGANQAAVGDFTNYHVGGTLYGEYRFTNSFALTATLDYSQTISDVALSTSTGPVGAAGTAGTLYDLSWRRFQALLGARLFF